MDLIYVRIWLNPRVFGVDLDFAPRKPCPGTAGTMSKDVLGPSFRLLTFASGPRAGLPGPVLGQFWPEC